MGLDMYLYHCPKGQDPELGPWPEPPDYETREGWAAVNELAYWRKANQVHAFFIEECAGGLDDCKPVLVHPEKLADLYQRCTQVLEDPDLAPIFLPTRPGFFFGSTDYGDDYFDDLRETLAQLDKKVMRNPKIRGDNLFYEASW